MEIRWVRTAFDQSSQGFEAAFTYLEELTTGDSEFFFDAEQEKIDMESVKREVRRRAMNGGRHLLFGMILILPAMEETVESISLLRDVMRVFAIHQSWQPLWFAKATRDSVQEKLHLLMFEEDTFGNRLILRDKIREDVVRIAQALLSENEEEKPGWLASSNIVI